MLGSHGDDVDEDADGDEYLEPDATNYVSEGGLYLEPAVIAITAATAAFTVLIHQLPFYVIW